MYFGTSTACVVAPSREGASPLPFGPQNKKLGNRCHNFILEILRPCAPYMAAIVTLFWGFWLFWLTFLLRQLQRVGNSKAKHWRWTTRGMSRNLCLFETPLQILYIHTFTEDLEGFPVSKKNWDHFIVGLLHGESKFHTFWSIWHHHYCMSCCTANNCFIIFLFPKGLLKNLQWRVNDACTLGCTQRPLYLDISWYHL